MSWLGRFRVHGVFWRQFLRWAVLHVPLWLEPIAIGTWSLVFLLWGPGRRGVMSNLKAILPGSSAAGNFLRTYRVFWNFAWSMTDNVRFKELRVGPDWDLTGAEYFEELRQREGGAIVLTAHMGNYDLGAHLFSEIARRQIAMVRAPETDPATRQYEEELHGRTAGSSLRIDFNTGAGDLAIDLLNALRRGEIIAIQGDRVTPGLSALEVTLFGKRTAVPAGPFALSMAARVPIYPLFVFRGGRRRYRLVACRPFEVIRKPDRDVSLREAAAQWSEELETIVRGAWYQWFAFEPFSPEVMQ